MAFYCWLYSVLHYGPRILLHECVPGFEVRVLQECLESKYIVSSIVWSSLDEGLPIRRERRYTLCLRKDMLPVKLSFELPLWSKLAFCKLVSSGRIFLQADSSKVLDLNKQMATRRNLPPVRVRSNGEEGEWAWEVLMSVSERSVLLQLREIAKKAKVDDGCWIVNLSQSLSFQRSPTQGLDVIPALLRSSKLFIDSFDRNQIRMIHPLECMAMQGLPVLLPRDHPLITVCDFERTLELSQVPLQQLKSLSGNGMNLSSVGKALFFALSVIRVGPKA